MRTNDQTELQILQSNSDILTVEEKNKTTLPNQFNQWYDDNDLTNGKLEVGLKFEIYEITHIDTSGQKYGIRGLMRITWKATKNDVKNFQKDKDNYTAEFEPRISFTNYIDSTSHEYRRTVIKKGYNEKCLHTNATYTDEFNVASFPFDSQDLVIALTQTVNTTSIINVPSHIENNYIRFDKTWSSITNWTIVGVDASKVELETKSFDIGAIYEIVMFRIQIKRKWQGIIYRLLLWLLFLGLMSWATFAVDASDIGDRLSYSITMALTIVAFQFIISDQLPQVNYLTLLDKYNLYVFTIVLLITFESTVVGYNGIGLVDNPSQFDDKCSFIAIVLFMVGNICFVVYGIYLFKFEERKIGKWNPYVKDVIYVSNKKGIPIIPSNTN